MKTNNKKTRKKGFTLVEMLVTIAIIAILIAVMIPVIGYSSVRAAAATNAANLRSLEGKMMTIKLQDPQAFDTISTQLSQVLQESWVSSTLVKLFFGDNALHKMATRTADSNGTIVLWDRYPSVTLTHIPASRPVNIKNFKVPKGMSMSLYFDKEQIVASYGEYTKEDFADVAADGKYDGSTGGGASGDKGWIGNIVEGWISGTCKNHFPDPEFWCLCTECGIYDHDVNGGDAAPEDHYCDACSYRLTECEDGWSIIGGALQGGKDYWCDLCNAKMPHACGTDENTDGKCDYCGEVLPHVAPGDCKDKRGSGLAGNKPDGKCDICGEECHTTCINNYGGSRFPQTSGQPDTKCDICGEPCVHECTDETGKNASLISAGTPNGKCDYCGKDVPHACIDETGKNASWNNPGTPNGKCDICDGNVDHSCDWNPIRNNTTQHQCSICDAKQNHTAEGHTCSKCDFESDCPVADYESHTCDKCGATSVCGDNGYEQHEDGHRCKICKVGKESHDLVANPHKCAKNCGYTTNCNTDGKSMAGHWCTLCGSESSATAHTDTRKSGGYTDHKCDACTYQFTECGNNGYTNSSSSQHRCNTCGTRTNHSYGEWSVVTAATCTKNGTRVHSCVCTRSVTETITKLGHDWPTEWTQTQAPTCTAKGSETHNCTRCSTPETRDVAALGHSWGGWTVVTPATCTSTGTSTRTCSRGCTENRTDSKTDHTYVDGVCSCGDEESSGGWPCVTPDTLITLADGSKKRVDEMTGSELLLVWNHTTGNLESVPVAYIVDHNGIEAEHEVIKLTFSDGSTIEIIGEHVFFDATLNKYVNLDTSAEAYIGHAFIGINETNDALSWITLVGVEKEVRLTKTYEIVSYQHLTCFTNNILSTSAYLDQLLNIFDINQETLTYDLIKMQEDIETYGLYTYEDFEDIISEEAFELYNAAYLKIAVGKGYITWDDIYALIDIYFGVEVEPIQ